MWTPASDSGTLDRRYRGKLDTLLLDRIVYCTVSVVTVEHQPEEGSPRVVDITLIKNQKGTFTLQLYTKISSRITVKIFVIGV